MNGFLKQLAWDCVAAGQQPPLHPTTCAIIRMVAMMGRCRFSQLARVVPCSNDALRQQLSRLKRAGVLEKRREGEVGFYVLGRGGVRMVLTWQREHARIHAELVRTWQGLQQQGNGGEDG